MLLVHYFWHSIFFSSLCKSSYINMAMTSVAVITFTNFLGKPVFISFSLCFLSPKRRKATSPPAREAFYMQICPVMLDFLCLTKGPDVKARGWFDPVCISATAKFPWQDIPLWGYSQSTVLPAFGGQAVALQSELVITLAGDQWMPAEWF